LLAVRDMRSYEDWVIALMRDLIAQGADVTARNQESLTPLRYARTPMLADLLMRADPDFINYQTDIGSLSLHRAVSLGLRIIAELLQAGFLGMSRGEEIIPTFVDAGADPDILDNRGISSRQLITEYGLGHLLPVNPDRGARTKPAVNP